MTYYDIENIGTNFGSLVQRRKVERGGILFLQGKLVDAIYFIDSGKVKVETYSEDTDESLVLYYAIAGMALAEEHIFLEHYGCSAIVEEDAEIRFIKKTVIQKRLAKDAGFASNFISCLSTRYGELRTLCNFLTIRRAEERLLAYLKWHAAKEGPILDLRGRLGLLGATLDLTKESVYRAMARLEHRGDISRKDGLVILQ
jgi:CRP/FNR family transcriptional regulator, dissimilatory nitrate respiration regulator